MAWWKEKGLLVEVEVGSYLCSIIYWLYNNKQMAYFYLQMRKLKLREVTTYM